MVYGYYMSSKHTMRNQKTLWEWRQDNFQRDKLFE